MGRICEHPVYGMEEQLIGGSARTFTDFETYDFMKDLVTIKVRETQSNIDGYNCEYFTILKLRKLD